VITYIRYNPSVQSKPRVFGPKRADHPSCGGICVICGCDFVPGDYTTLIPLGPGRDTEAQLAHAEGRWYNAVAIEVHAECAGVSVQQNGGAAEHE